MQKFSFLRIGIYTFIFFLSLFLWAIFYPALMNADSIVQYQQALSGNFNDWHPAFMSVIVYFIIEMGGDVSTVTLFQSLLSCFGIYFLSRQILLFGKDPSPKLDLLALLPLLILVTPISALTYYMFSFIKDTWLAIAFIWIAFLGVYLMRKAVIISNAKFFLILLVLLLAMSSALLLRHNALVMVPVFFVMLFYIFKKSKKINGTKWQKYSLFSLMGILPLLLFFLSSSFIYKAFEVERTYPESQVIAMESLGVLVEQPNLSDELSYMHKHLSEDYQEAYIPGNVAPVMPWGPIKAVDQNFTIDHPKLKEQYYALYATAPHILAKVKWDGFRYMIFPEYRYWFHPQLDNNVLGISQNSTFEAIRNFLIQTSHFIYSTFLSYLFGEHIVWLIINLFLIVYLFIKKDIKNKQVYILILLLPLVYYFSYLIAATGPQFRFMFPSSLLLQIIILAFLTGEIVNQMDKKNIDSETE